MNINATLIGQSISFLFFVLFCTKYIWPPIINALNERQKKIADSIEAAHRADKKIIQSKQIAEATIENANKQAANIIDRAKKQSQQIIDAAKQQAIKNAELIIYEANKETEQQIRQAKAELRIKLADLIVIGAEKLISDKFDKSANDEYIKQLTCKL